MDSSDPVVTPQSMEMPLQPTKHYIVAELIEIKFFHPLTLPDGTESALEGAGGRGTPIMRVVAVGRDATGWAVGDYFVTHPQNSELSWYWTQSMPFQVIKPEVICARLDKEVIEEMLRRMKKFDKPVKLPKASRGMGPHVMGPPKKKIVLPEDADLPPQL